MIIKLQIIVPEMLGTERVWGACMDIPKRGKRINFTDRLKRGETKAGASGYGGRWCGVRKCRERLLELRFIWWEWKPSAD